MKRILCYGDSNTWGSGSFGGRIDDEKQWPNILQKLLSSNCKVIQEGLNGRIAGDFEISKPFRSGKLTYEPILRSASPVDMVIIALGTNDLKHRYDRSVQQIVDDLLWYGELPAKLAKRYNESIPKMLYLLPANFISSEYFDADEELRQNVIEIMKQTGQHCVEMEDSRMVEDGVHYSIEAHEKVAKAVFEKVKETEKLNEI